AAETDALRVLAAMRLLNFGWRRGLAADEAAAIFADGMALAERSGDERARIALLNSYGILRGFAGDVPGAVECIGEATRRADANEDFRLQLGSRVSLVEAFLMAGDHRAALRTIEETFDRLETAPRRNPGDIDLIDPTTWVTMMRGWVLFEMGRVAEGE